MSDWKTDLRDSTRQFVEIVWPEISHWFGDDIELIPVEGVDEDLHQTLDRAAGIDFWIVKGDIGMVSLASRVQGYDYTTFTIRYSRASGRDTEYQKRMRQLDTEYELPTYTIQAYVDPVLEVLRNAAACQTDELFRFVKSGEPGEEWPLIPTCENEKFLAIEWAEIDPVCDLYVYNRSRPGLPKRHNEIATPENPEDITAWGERA